MPIPFHVKRYLHPRFNQSAELLIDDVMTTGANLYEAAKTLHRVGSDPFRGPVLARVLRHRLKPLLSGANFSIERYDRRQVLHYDMVVLRDY